MENSARSAAKFLSICQGHCVMYEEHDDQEAVIKGSIVTHMGTCLGICCGVNIQCFVWISHVNLVMGILTTTQSIAKKFKIHKKGLLFITDGMRQTSSKSLKQFPISKWGGTPYVTLICTLKYLISR